MANEVSNPEYANAVDMIRAEIVDPGYADEAISLSSGVKLVRGMQVMIQSAAWAAVQPSGILEGSKPALTGKYIRAVHLGQTDTRPYAISILSPLSAEFESPDDDLPYSRQAVQTLATALRAIVEFTARPSWDEEVLMELIRKGVSANLCSGAAVAIQAIGKRKAYKRASLNSNPKAVRIAFHWSPTLSPSRDTPGSVTLEPEMWETIKQLDAALKSFVKNDFRFEGYVTQFAIGRGERSGRIVIERMSEDRPGRFLLEVSELAYDQALDALRDKLLVSGMGTLVRNGGQFLVIDLKSFAVQELETN